MPHEHRRCEPLSVSECRAHCERVQRMTRIEKAVSEGVRELWTVLRPLGEQLQLVLQEPRARLCTQVGEPPERILIRLTATRI